VRHPVLANTELKNSYRNKNGLTIRIHLRSEGLYMINSEADNVQGNDIEHKMANECNGYFCTENRMLWETEEQCLKNDFEITPFSYHWSVYHVKRYQLRSSLRICIQNSSNSLFLFHILPPTLNTLRTGDADLRLYITTVQDG